MLKVIASVGVSLLAAVSENGSAVPKPRALPPPAEMMRQSAADLVSMRRVLQDSLSRLEDARNTKDVVKLNCVNEKLTQVKGLLRISEQADVALQEAVAKREQLAAEHEFTKVSIAGEKVQVLRNEAEECIGQLAFQTDQNLTVEVDTPDGLPKDPTDPAPMLPVFSRPPIASPIR